MVKIITALFLKSFKILFLVTLLLVLNACSTENSSLIEFSEGSSLLTLAEEEKNEIYQSLDALEIYEGEDSPAIEAYSQIQEIDGDDYYELMEESNRGPVLLMFAQEDCPYCKAFVPKLNQLSKELDIIIYYYDTQDRINDEDFNEIIAEFDIQTVPHAFIIHQEDLIDKINHLSSMQEIESFLYQAH